VYVDDQRFGGFFEWTNQDGTPNTLAPRNPLSLLEQTDNRGWVNRGLGNIQLDYRFPFLPQLRANLNLGYEGSVTGGRTNVPATAAPAFVLGGTSQRYAQNRSNKLADFYLQYNENLPSINSRFDVQAGYSYQHFDFNNPTFPTITPTEEIAASDPIGGPQRLIALFGRVNYAFMDRYLFTATVRRDGTSRFSPENRWGTFPSVAFAWRISEEAFLRDANIFSELKLRTSYGTTGQQDLGGNLFPYLPVYLPSDQRAQYRLGDTYYSTLRPNGYDRNIRWEVTDAFNVGLDFAIAQNRVTGSFDYFDRNTRDILLEVDVAAGSNLTNRLLTNVGTMRSRGVEGAINFAIISNERMHWDFGVNATYLDARVGRLNAVGSDTAVGVLVGGISGGVGNTVQVHSTGFRPATFFTYQQVYDANGRPVEGLYVDQNGDGVINELDLKRQFNPEPRVLLGINSQFSYNRFSAGFTMRANIGNYMYNNVAANTSAFQSFGFDNYLNNVTPAIYGTGFNNYQYMSNYYIENASFLRLENLNFGYDVGNIFSERATLRLNANVINAFVITRYTGLDPEVAGGIDNNIYPRPRIISVGLNLGF
jgi:TonB-dependent starch-binding outer membrane protein SusC